MHGMQFIMQNMAIGSGRLLPTAVAVAALIGVIAGVIAFAQSRRHQAAGTKAIAAILLGIISVMIAALHIANSAGGVGTGNGLAGAFAAVALGSVATLFGVIALVRSR